MAQHIEAGKEGEQLAENYLLKNGFSILHRNWRYSHYEIDIVALKNGIPHFVEVKLRNSRAFGWPEEAVTKKKITSLLQAANQFMYRHAQYKDFRLDILSITSYPNMETEYYFIQDIYL
ncbi:MAG: YraN family protein [Flavisolibacter sp.]